MTSAVEKNRMFVSAAKGMTAFYVVSGVAAMLLLSPQIPYADSWRFLARLIESPFPINILASDNGHREIIPNLIRLADLKWFSASQSFQTFCGIFFALLTLGLFILKVHTSDLTAATQKMVILLGALGIFWLGNIRVLGHASEAIHAYLITACLILGILLLLNEVTTPAKCFFRGLCVGSLGFIASFSFGSGVACFAAFYLVLYIRNSRWHSWFGVTLWLALVMAVTIYSDTSGYFVFSPVVQINNFLSWISAPLIYMVWPLLDPAVAAQIPVTSVQVLFLNAATSVEGIIGPIVLGPWPLKLVGLSALLLLLRETWIVRFRYAAIPMLGIAISWFSVAVGGLIVIGRYEYFLDNPEQVMAARYIVWSSWFWMGLAISIVSRETEGMKSLLIALFLSLALMPSQIWMGKLGVATRNASEFGALAVTLNAYNSDTKMGENIDVEILHISPQLKHRMAGIFAWPEMHWLNRHPPAQIVVMMDVSILDSKTVINLSGEEWLELAVTCNNCTNKNLVVLDQQGLVIGIVHQIFGGNRWVGWAKASVNEEYFQFAMLR